MNKKIRLLLAILVCLYTGIQVCNAEQPVVVSQIIVGYDVVRRGETQLIQVMLKNVSNYSIPVNVHIMATLPSRNIVLVAKKRALAEDRSFTRVLLEYPLKGVSLGRYTLRVRVFDAKNKLIAKTLNSQFAQFYVYKTKPPLNWLRYANGKKDSDTNSKGSIGGSSQWQGKASGLVSPSVLFPEEGNGKGKKGATNNGKKQSSLLKGTAFGDNKKPTTIDGNQDKKASLDLGFKKADVFWYRLSVRDASVLRGEIAYINVWIQNKGGDNAQKIDYTLYWYFSKYPSRKIKFYSATIPILAPGEVKRTIIPVLIPKTEIVGQYKIYGVLDPENKIKEIDKDNNRADSTDSFIFDDISLVTPEPDEEGRITLADIGQTKFAWRSNKFNQFKLQISPTITFADTKLILNIPKGDRWTSLKEVHPFSGELLRLAKTLMETQKVDFLYWRVMGRTVVGNVFYSQVYHLYFSKTKTPENEKATDKKDKTGTEELAIPMEAE